MIGSSLAEGLAGRATMELGRVAAARPELGSRCERAAAIVARHLESPRSCVIRAQLRGGELVGYLVCGRGGAIYRVEAKGSWRCSCPDHYGRHRRRGSSRACKHALAVWALWRAAGVPSPAALAFEAEIAREGGEASGEEEDMERRRVSCSGCGARYRRSALVELDEDNHDNLTYFHGDLLCGPCCDGTGVVR
ncbi:MAG: hypothetical protein M3Q49_01690 [Actinomycetota bacterium]|nr:hypothetical protein [Actinomycetota bacterium]